MVPQSLRWEMKCWQFRRSLTLPALLCRGAAYAGNDNGGLCNFPYCACFTAWPSQCLEISNMQTVGQEFSFTLNSKCDQPLGFGCAQDFYKLEWNSCRWQGALESSGAEHWNAPAPRACALIPAASSLIAAHERICNPR